VKGFFVIFLTFSLNEGNRTPYRESVASALKKVEATSFLL
jgi:hypothetical protein